jgi:hypothetical protein
VLCGPGGQDDRAGAGGEEGDGALDVSLLGCKKQCSAASIGLGLQLRAQGDEQGDGVVVSAGSGNHERGRTSVCFCLDLRSALYEESA